MRCNRHEDSAQTLYLMIDAAILTASAIQLIRGFRFILIAVAAAVFLLMGHLTVYLAGAKKRAVNRQRKRDYYSGI